MNLQQPPGVRSPAVRLEADEPAAPSGALGVVVLDGALAPALNHTVEGLDPLPAARAVAALLDGVGTVRQEPQRFFSALVAGRL